MKDHLPECAVTVLIVCAIAYIWASIITTGGRA